LLDGGLYVKREKRKTLDEGEENTIMNNVQFEGAVG
jgi:hypothetical protein